tara:strand:+ start:12693 stop:12914 length:222 start_codon:yes stop_codon:yes gene_type:complete
MLLKLYKAHQVNINSSVMSEVYDIRTGDDDIDSRTFTKSDILMFCEDLEDDVVGLTEMLKALESYEMDDYFMF